MPTYQQIHDSQSASSSGRLLVAAFLATTFASAPQPTNAEQHEAAVAQVQTIPVSAADRIVTRIHEIAENPELRDEGEEAPSQRVIEVASQLIRQANEIMPIPYGIPSTFFGEVTVTWRVDSDIVRLACFLDRPNIVQTGSIVEPVGSYRSEPATAQLLIEHLRTLVPIPDPEGPILAG